MNDLLLLENVEKSYRRGKRVVPVLKDINLSVNKGSFTGIIGPSGAGKSTLLYLIGLLSDPDKGNIFLNGQKVSKISDKKRSFIRNKEIGFIFQGYHLLPEFSALENIMMPAIINGISKKQAEKDALSLLQRVELSHRALHRSTELSGGEQQRVCICRALVNRPKLILADEPTGNLDTKNAELVTSLLMSLCKEYQSSLIMVTHNEGLLEPADKTIQLLDGKVVEVR